MTRGEIGCFLSHRKVWYDMIQNQVPFAFIMEDDIQYSTKIEERFQTIIKNLNAHLNDWDICYTAYYFMRWFDSNKKICSPTDEIVSTNGWTDLAGYFLSLNGAKRLYSLTDRTLPNEPVDVFIGKQINQGFRALRVKPRLCTDVYSNSWTSIFFSDTIRIR